MEWIDYRYIAVIYNTIVHKAQQLQWQELSQTLHSRTTPHIVPLRASHGCLSWVIRKNDRDISRAHGTVYPKKYAHGFCFAVLCCGYTLTDFPISIRLTSLALWQSNDCPSASKATLMNMDKYFMWIHYERLHNHNKAKHNKTVCIFLGIYCICNGDRRYQWFMLWFVAYLQLVPYLYPYRS